MIAAPAGGIPPGNMTSDFAPSRGDGNDVRRCSGSWQTDIARATITKEAITVQTATKVVRLVKETDLIQ